MKADPFVQLRLLDLQALDTALDRLGAQAPDACPRSPRSPGSTGSLDSLRADVVVAETEVSDLQRELDKADADIEQVRVRKARDEDRLASGAITQPKQLEELQHEVATLSKRQNDLEDAELEVMERMEEAQARLSELLAAARASTRPRGVRWSSTREEAFLDLDAEAGRPPQERAELAAEPSRRTCSPSTRRSAPPRAASEPVAIERGRCGGCHVDLMNNEKAEYRAAPTDEVLRHESCGRILVRTAESGL